MEEKKFVKSDELVQLQSRHRRRTEKDVWATRKYPMYCAYVAGQTPREAWKVVGAHWSGMDKSRVKRTHSNKGTAMGTALEIQARNEAIKIGARQARSYAALKERPPVSGVKGDNAPEVSFVTKSDGKGKVAERNPLNHAPEQLKVYNDQGEVIAVKSSGIEAVKTPHFAVNSGMESLSEGRHGAVHPSAVKMNGREARMLGIVQLEKDIFRLEKTLAEIRALGGNDRQMARKIRAMKHKLEGDKFSLRMGGVAERMHSQNEHAGMKSKRQATSEAIQARL